MPPAEGATLEPTPIFSSLVSEVLSGASAVRSRLSTVRTGIDRLHAPDQFERCPVCREDWPCTTRRLVDGLSRGELDATAGLDLVDQVLEQEVIDLDVELAGESGAPAAAAEAAPAQPAAIAQDPAAPEGEPSTAVEEEPREQPVVPAFADLLDTGRTSKALDLLFGGRAD